MRGLGTGEYSPCMLFRPSTVKDDRGRRVPLVISTREADARFRERLKRDAERREKLPRVGAVAEQSKQPSRIRRIAMWPLYAVFAVAGIAAAGAFFAVAAGAACLPLIGIAYLLGWPPASGIGATVVVAFVAGGTFAIVNRDQSRTERARRLARIEVCGACGYSLEKLEPGADECVACPECGAAWKVSPADSARCYSCDEQLETLTVQSSGVGECPYCGAAFAFAPAEDEENE